MKDYFGYQGKTVVVTGASSGMGKATAEMLVDLGADVYALSRRTPAIEGLKKAIPTDLSDKTSIDRAFAEIPDHIDSFFGVAGASGLHDTFLTTVKIDLIANKYITEEYLEKRMTAGGTVGYITSTGGLYWEVEGNRKHYLPVIEAEGWDGAVAAVEASPLVNLPGNLGYAFSKQAMHGLVAMYQKRFAAQGIRVNALLPGSTDTGLIDDFITMTGGRDNLLKYAGYAGRFAAPEEMAQPMVFLNSDMASYMSGTLLIVDYGTSIEKTAGIIEDQMAAMTFDAILARFAQR